MNRHSAAFVFLIGFLILIPAAGLSGEGAAETDSQAQVVQSLTIALLPDVDSLPFVVADLKGYYEEEGVAVELLAFKSPVDRDSAFQAGTVDGVISDVLAAAFALNGGFEVTITSATNGSYKLLAAGGSGIESVAGFKGKEVGMSLNTIIEYSTDRMLTAAGMRSEAIEKVVIPQIPVRLEMLSAGKIDGATLPEPLATMAVLKGARIIDSTDRMGINPGVMLFSSRSAAEKPEAVRALYRGYNRAIEYLQTAPRDEYIDEIIPAMGFPPAVRDAMVLPDYTQAQLPPRREIEEVIEWLSERNLIDDAFTYNELVTPGLLPR